MNNQSVNHVKMNLKGLYGTSIVPLMMKNISVRCLGCIAEVTCSAKVLSLMMSILGRDETVHFFFSFLFNMNTKAWPSISVHHKNTTT